MGVSPILSSFSFRVISCNFHFLLLWEKGLSTFEKAAKKLQSFARRRWQHQRQSPLVRSAVANPFWRPIEVGGP